MPNDLQNFNTLDSGEIMKNTLTEEQLRIITAQQQHKQGEAESKEKSTQRKHATTKDESANECQIYQNGRTKE